MQTLEGAKKAVITNISKHGSYEAWCKWMAVTGSKGGLICNKRDPITGAALKGFAVNKELAKEAGRKGGTKSRRGKAQ